MEAKEILLSHLFYLRMQCNLLFSCTFLRIIYGYLFASQHSPLACASKAHFILCFTRLRILLLEWALTFGTMHKIIRLIRMISNRWNLFPSLSMWLWVPLIWSLTTVRWILGTAPFSSLFRPLCVSATSLYCHRTSVLWAFLRWVRNTNQICHVCMFYL